MRVPGHRHLKLGTRWHGHLHWHWHGVAAVAVLLDRFGGAWHDSWSDSGSARGEVGHHVRHKHLEVVSLVEEDGLLLLLRG